MNKAQKPSEPTKPGQPGTAPGHPPTPETPPGHSPPHPVSTVHAATAFDKAVALIFELEGGWSNDPADSGGETNLGITQHELTRWQLAHKLPPMSVKALTHAYASEIYRDNYWDAVKADDLPWPLNLVAFDAAVNQGDGAAALMLGKLLGQTEHTVTAYMVNRFKTAEPVHLALALLKLREHRYLEIVQRHPQDHKFLRGWENRLIRVAHAAGIQYEPS